MMITRIMGRLFPQHVKASHINMPLTGLPYPWKHPIVFLQSLAILFSPKDKARLASINAYRTVGNGYFVEQSTKPQTIGYSLQDSPTGLLAWIYEKLHDWTDGYPFTDDEILTWISIYYFSRAGPAASVRIYYESDKTKVDGLDTFQALLSYNHSVKLGIAYFPKEIISMPKAWGHTLGRVVQQSEFEKGGHFAAYEMPEELAGDLKKMFGKGGPGYGVVTGKDGL